MVTINIAVARGINQATVLMMAAKDKRLQLASETFLGIRASTAKEDERTTAF